MDSTVFHLKDKLYKYFISHNYEYLYSIPHSNRVVLDKLYNYQEDKIEYFLSNAYGYRPNMFGGWPECHNNDKDALYRAIVLTKCACYQPLYADDYTLCTEHTQIHF